MKGWSEVKLEELCEIKGGKRLPEGHVLVDFKTDHPYIKARDIRSGKISSQQIQYITDKTFEKIKRYTVNKDDICVTIVANIGDAGIVPPELNGANLTENAVKLTRLSSSVSPQFLSLLLASKSYKSYMELLAAGAAQSKLGIYKLKIIKVKLPKIDVQKNIAAVLSAYDDLIENNKRRIALLEKMAEEIYREWFVRLRFPGHEKVKVVKGVPEGWGIEKIKSVVSRLPFGRIYRESELADTGKVIVMDQSQAEFLGFYDGEPQHKATAEKPIILFGDHSCKMLMMVKPFSLAENVIPFVSKNDAPVYFLFHLVKGTIETTEYKRHWTELTNKEIYLPPTPLQQRFQEIVKPYYQQIELLNDAVRFATKSRDMLLPRLISGKLSVEDLDIQFSPGLEP